MGCCVGWQGVHPTPKFAPYIADILGGEISSMAD